MAVTVIVIENDSQVQDFLCSILERQRYTAIRATTYEEALHKLRSSTVDLAVSDGFTANGISGISLLHSFFPHLRLIVISGSVSNKAEIPLPAHLVHVLPKPCGVTEFVQTVRHALAEFHDHSLQAILERGRLHFVASQLLAR
jgi:DNA-binding NtrC family response regulator